MQYLKISNFIKMITPAFLVYMFGYALEVSWDKYHIIWWPNRVVHLLGGLSIAILAYYLLDLVKKYNLIKTKNKFVDFVLMLLFVMSITVLWEFYEFLSDKYLFTRAQLSVDDTIKDMFMGMLGAVSFGIGWAISSIFKSKKL